MSRKKEEIQIKQFSNKTDNWWYGSKHYSIIDGELEVVSGGEEDKKETEILKKHLKL